MIAAPKMLWIIYHEIKILDFPGDGAGSSLDFPPSSSSSSLLVSGGGWEVWPVKYRQNLEDHKNEYR